MENFEGAPQSSPQVETPLLNPAELGVSPEQRKVLNSGIELAKFITNRWPQVDTQRKPVLEIDRGIKVELPELPEGLQVEPKINYYLVGSLASMILSQAERFTEIDEGQFPTIVEVGTREIPESARAALSSFARQIGDLDFVPADHYKANPQALGKGGVFSFEEVPAEARQALKQEMGAVKVMCDPVEVYGAKKIAKVTIKGKDYYIARPDSIFAYKVLHLLLNYEQKPEKFNADFDKIQRALGEIYDQKGLLETTRQLIIGYEQVLEGVHHVFNQERANPIPYEEQMPGKIEKVLAHPQISPQIRAVLEGLRGKAEDKKI